MGWSCSMVRSPPPVPPSGPIVVDQDVDYTGFIVGFWGRSLSMDRRETALRGVCNSRSYHSRIFSGKSLVMFLLFFPSVFDEHTE